MIAPLPTAGHDDIERKAARGGVITAVAQGGKGALEAGTGLFLARVLAPGDFGLVEMIVSVTGIIDLFKDFGLSSATVQREKIDHAQINVLFWINVGIGAALTLLTVALAPLVAYAYAKPELLKLTAVLSLSTLLGALSIQHQALLRRSLQFGRIAWIDVVSSLIGSSCAVLAAVQGLGVWALVIRNLARLGTQALMTFLLSSWRPTAPRSADVRDLLTFGKHISGFQLMNYLERNFDNILIGRFAGAAPLGLYARAYELMRLPLNLVNAPLAAVAVPALSRLVSFPERYQRAYLSVLRLLLLVTVPLAPLSILAAEWLVPTVLGPQWNGSVPMFQWLALGLIVKPLLNTTSWLFISQGRGQDLWRWGYMGSSIALVAFLIGLPWGALGVAISYTIIDLLIRAPLLIWWTGRTGPVGTRDLWRSLKPAWLCALAVALTYYGLASQLRQLGAGARTAACAGAAVIAWLATMWAVPSGRAAVRDGLAMVGTLRKPAAG